MLHKLYIWRMRRLSRTVYRQQVNDIQGDDIQQYVLFGKQQKTDRIVRKLHKMVCRRSEVYESHPVETYGLTLEEFHDLFICIMQHGGGRWIRGFYPPVFSFCSEATLLFVVMNKDNILNNEHLRKQAVRMLLTYFAGLYLLPNVDMKEALADPLSALDAAVRELEAMV